MSKAEIIGTDAGLRVSLIAQGPNDTVDLKKLHEEVCIKGKSLFYASVVTKKGKVTELVLSAR